MIFQNKEVFPKVFISESHENKYSNQELYRTNYMKKFIEIQKQANKRTNESLQNVNRNLTTSKINQDQYFSKLLSQTIQQEVSLVGFKDQLTNQNNVNQSSLEKLEQLENLINDVSKKLESNELINQVILDQLTNHDHFTQVISQKLLENDLMLQSLSQQLMKQEELYQDLTEKLNFQEVFHKAIMERLEHQEALSEKITRQLEYIKGIVFERFSHLSDKIEDGFKLTSRYLFRYLPKSLNLEDSKVEMEEEEYSKQ